MKLFVALLLAAVAVAMAQEMNIKLERTSFRAKKEQGLRLLEFQPDNYTWVTAEQLDKLIFNTETPFGHDDFMDITDFYETYLQPNLANRLVPTAYPTTLTQQEVVNKLISTSAPAHLEEIVKDLCTRFFSRYHASEGGEKAVQHLAAQYQAIVDSLPDDRKALFEVKIEKNSDRPWNRTTKMSNLVVRMFGSDPDPQVAKQEVIIGGHLDSINLNSRTGPAPGCDDDGSGSATVFEAFRTIAKSAFKPSRTLTFMHYAAEEIGLIGSQAIAQIYKTEYKRPVYAVMQFDMTGYNGSPNNIGVITDYTTPALSTFVRLLIKEYTAYKKSGDDRCGYPCSDHASWQKNGYPAAMIFEVGPPIWSHINRNIHTPRDTIEKLDFKHAFEYEKVALGFAVELGVNRSDL